jgi:hypothetical protein
LRTGMERGRGGLSACVGPGGMMGLPEMKAAHQEDLGDLQRCEQKEDERTGGGVREVSDQEAASRVEAQRSLCIKHVLQDIARRGESDVLRDGGEQSAGLVRELVPEVQKKLAEKAEGGAWGHEEGRGHLGLDGMQEAELAVYLRGALQERRLVHAWLKPRLDKAIQKLEQQEQLQQFTQAIRYAK